MNCCKVLQIQMRKAPKKPMSLGSIEQFMWGFLQTIVISIIFIVSSHFAFQYVKNTLTTKKTKNIMDFQLQKYKNMLEEATSVKSIEKIELGELTADHYLGYFKDVLETRSNDTPFYEPSVMGDDTQSEMGSVVDYTRMEEELLEMI